MNIGIYGDSFACYQDEVYQQSNTRRSWVDYLGDHHQIKNYAMTGSTFSYTHNHVLKFHNRHDLNIVLVTNYARLNLFRLKTTPKFAPGLNYIEHRLSQRNSDHDRTILEAARDFYLYVEDEEDTKKFHYLMLDEIKRIVPNLILVPCFMHSLTSTEMTKCLSDISHIDNRYYKKHIFMVDKKRCHLNDKNNKILATKLLEHIDGNKGVEFKINIDDYVEPFNEPFDYNFKV